MTGSSERTEAGAPASAKPLVLLPGTLCDARVFAPVLSLLPGVTATVPAMAGAETTSAMADQLLAILPDRFALGGFSLGGIVALEMVARAPERITRLALISTTARPDKPDRAALRRAAVERAATIGVGRFVVEELWPSYVADAGRTDAAQRDMIEAMAADAGIDIFRQHTAIAIHRQDSRPRLAAVALPTLVLCGADDQLCPPELSREIAALIPGALLSILPEAGHFALTERPDAVAAVVSTWLTMPT